MTSHTTISPQEAADRLAIRELIDAYAHCADQRDAKGQMALFTPDTRFIVFMDTTATEPTQELHGRDSLAQCSITSIPTSPPCTSTGKARSS